MLEALFQKHPREIGETYGEHAGHALFIGTRMLFAGFACLIHAVFPGFFVHTASGVVDDINALMARRQARASTGNPLHGIGTVPATMIENPSN